MTTALSLPFNLTFADLYAREGLETLDQEFLGTLQKNEAALHQRLLAARRQVHENPESFDKKDESQLLLDLAPHLEQFIAKLFGIEKEVEALVATHKNLAPLYACKRLFVQRRAAKAHKPEEAAGFDGSALQKKLEPLLNGPFSEENFSIAVMRWLENETAHAEQLTLATQYAAWAMHTPQGQSSHKHGVLFKTPKKLDYAHLVPVETVVKDGITMLRLPQDHLRPRDGFGLTDPGADLKEALDHAHYCIFCHHQGKDSCSKGLKEKDGSFKQSPTRVPLAGCPLEEKISEMNELKSTGVPLGALAVVVIDNPMCGGTGHRICNDCMKSCIYQKQEPVNIPQVETRTLKDVLALPWGFEIYSLLTRWNPLNLARPLPKPDTGRKVLVAGMGPAGYTLAHHLLNDGHTVVGIDGLKIEPLPQEISGVTTKGERVAFAAIRDVETLYESLDERVLAGFGGVAEYGITVRWNKNFLKLLRLLLERRSHFSLFGGVRFGGTITVENAAELGFDHVALCMGAGKPRLLDIPNGLARGVRTASDFLMALQLTGAAKRDSLANLQLRLPVVIVGGGLTAMDAATESLAYYPVQVEKFLRRYETLTKTRGEQAVRAAWTAEETENAEEFIAHARALRAERAQAEKENRAPNFIPLLEKWGGVTILYRQTLTDAPSYRLNHEEVEKAFEEGIRFAENVTPTQVEIDAKGHARALVCTRVVQEGEQTRKESITFPARAILIAAGTQPNTVIQREDPAHFTLDGQYFQAEDENGAPVHPEQIAKPSKSFVLLKPPIDGARNLPSMSFLGDLHPSFAGNVVKAMGSALKGYPVISRALAKRSPVSKELAARFLEKLSVLLVPTVHAVERLTPTIIEVVLHAPLAARNFQPGQFYRLQNYEHFALQTASTPTTLQTTLAMEGLALTGAWVDHKKGLLSTIVLEMGGSSDLCAYLKPGEPVVLMGPTGTPTEIPENETVLLAGGGLGNAVLFSIGKALREKGNKVLYFAGYKKNQDRYKIQEIEAAADVVVWACDEVPAFTADRKQDRVFHGNIVQAMLAWQNGQLGAAPSIPLSKVDRIIAIGSDRMMAAVASARHTVLKQWLKETHVAIGSINSPMQCMMKEICAQCLQKHVDPVTGKESYVFSCFNQDQELDCVSFEHLQQRLAQNGLQEKLTAQWVDHCLREIGVRQAVA